MTPLTVADYLIQAIRDAGVRHLFMLPGGGCMHLVDAVGRTEGLEFVANLHEQAAAIAADAYGQYTNNLGAALVTTGPGGTNALTGVAAAWLDSTPTIFVSGQVKRADLATGRGLRQCGFQEIDIVSMVSGITKYAVTLTEPEEVRYHLEKALYLARHGRPGPVWLDVPLDVQALPIDPERQRGFVPEPADQGIGGDLASLVGRTMALFNASERPVILAGNGVRLGGGLPAFRELVDRLQIPVLTTWKALDFLPEDHPLFVGRPGSIGQRGANFTQQNADFLLVLGARLDPGQTGYSHANFARGASKVVVDIDPAELAKISPAPAIAACADAGAFIRALLAAGESIAPCDRSAWRERCQAWQARYPVILPEYWDEAGSVNPYVLIDVLSEAMTEADLLVPGSSGACSELTMQAFRTRKGQRVLNSEGLGPMGFGIAAALGACLASGGRRTVCVDGDGGFHMNTQELETVRRLGLPLKFFVLNNAGYGSIRITQRSYFEGRFVASDAGSGLSLPDTLRIAEAYGVPAARIASHGEIRETVRKVLEAPGPVVCEVVVDPEHRTVPRLSSARRADGSMVSKPLEDLWPFLDREEFRQNMLVPVLEDWTFCS